MLLERMTLDLLLQETTGAEEPLFLPLLQVPGVVPGEMFSLKIPTPASVYNRQYVTEEENHLLCSKYKIGSVLCGLLVWRKETFGKGTCKGVKQGNTS